MPCFMRSDVDGVDQPWSLTWSPAAGGRCRQTGARQDFIDHEREGRTSRRQGIYTALGQRRLTAVAATGQHLSQDPLAHVGAAMRGVGRCQQVHAGRSQRSAVPTDAHTGSGNLRRAPPARSRWPEPAAVLAARAALLSHAAWHWPQSEVRRLQRAAQAAQAFLSPRAVPVEKKSARRSEAVARLLSHATAPVVPAGELRLHHCVDSAGRFRGNLEGAPQSAASHPALAAGGVCGPFGWHPGLVWTTKDSFFSGGPPSPIPPSLSQPTRLMADGLLQLNLSSRIHPNDRVP